MKINPINNNNNISYKSKLKVTPELTAYLKKATPSQLKAYEEGCQKLLKDGKNKVYEYKNEIYTCIEQGKKYKALKGVILDENQKEYNFAFLSEASEESECKDTELKANSNIIDGLLHTLFEPTKRNSIAWEYIYKSLRIPRAYSSYDFNKETFIPNL